MRQAQYSKLFFNPRLAFVNFEKAKSYIADQFGFDRAYVHILRSNSNHVRYPLYLDNYNNYIAFRVKDNIYECINGELQLLSKEG
jgi:hypothetical protein